MARKKGCGITARLNKIRLGFVLRTFSKRPFIFHYDTMPRNSVQTKFQPMSTIRRAALFAALSVAVFCSGDLFAQQADGQITLDIGSKAPVLDVETWISNRDGAFQPVTDFTEGKVYVVEFWATWCGPCVASMPHLAEIQNKYYDKGVQIISVTDEDMDTVGGFLERNVRGKEDLTYSELTSTYCLTADPDGSTNRDYMEAAGQTGIPTAFIVGKSGLIEWTGHPVNLDDALQAVVADTWDRDAFKLEMQKERERKAAIRAIRGEVAKAMQEVDQKLSADDEAGALALFGKVIDDDKFQPMREQLTKMRAQLALTMKAPEALVAYQAGVETFKQSPQDLNEISWAAVELMENGKTIQPGLLTAALRAAQTALEADANDPSVLDTVAHLFQLTGDLDKAIATQELAVKHAGDLAPQIEPYLNELKAQKAAQ